MIRTLVGSALPILGLGAVAALLGPDLVTGPRGEPLIVAAPPAAAVQEASFDGSVCTLPLLFAEEDELLADAAKPDSGRWVVTLAFRHGPDGARMAIEKDATDPEADATVVIVFDSEGRIVAVAHPPSQRERLLAEAYAAGCVRTSAGSAPAGI